MLISIIIIILIIINVAVYSIAIYSVVDFSILFRQKVVCNNRSIIIYNKGLCNAHAT